MNKRSIGAASNPFLAIALCAASAGGMRFAPSCYAMPASQQAPQAGEPGTASRRIGAVKGINGTVITITQDFGPDVNVTVQVATQILRIAPGETSLKNATPIQLQDLQIGDRIRVTGEASGDNLFLAAKIVAMKRSDLDARHQQDLQDWQKRGVGGLVTAVDAAAGTVTISVTSFAGKKNIVIHSSGTTVLRRYAPDSVKFDDAKPGTLQEVHPGDQVRARGDRSADGSEVAAEEIVSGSFRNVAGTISSVDASLSTLSVQDLLSKKTVVIKVAADSQLRHLPPEMAQRIALRLKGAATGAAAQPATAAGQPATAEVSPGGTEGGTGPRGSGMGGRSGGAPDFQQMLSRMPASSLADLHKGDAVIVVSTEGTAGVGTAIQLVSGVEPILQAAPNAGQAMMLAPWSLGGPSGDAGGP